MDKEINAITEITKLFSELEPEAIKRVLDWAGKRFLGAKSGISEDGEESDQEGHFQEFHEFFTVASPSSSPEKALVVGYWFQEILHEKDLDGYQLNQELKNLGHGSSNITRDLNALINKTPRLAIQIKKSGTSKQARKKYKLTTEGIRVVKDMLKK